MEMVKTKKQAHSITGGLSDPSKLPCKAWGISAWKCQTGQKLAKIDGTPCAQCYAMQGSYTMYPAIPIAHANRLAAIDSPYWIPAMVKLIGNDPFFRWFDSGDIQSIAHLEKICVVAVLTPGCMHWLPTQERAYVKACGDIIPHNLVVRISQTLVDKVPAKGSKLSSMVSTGGALPAHVKDCPSRFQNNECKDCRACWNPEIESVAYHSHGHKIKKENLITIKGKAA